ncbi:Phosphatidylinositide phosphatase SAC2 [Hypsibius exemplaris]|uniref:Phosphatidylinositide phosphatase SAC2 n=1 Tax=Hypsibius exemplaris TaxID=2072580 RepID=A0A9X6RN18_HYPEX|nr:Phosphatidylinositide phosphatase SAC2 [Hypsibius exemplaris]
MQLFKSRSHYLFVDGEHCLWCSRFDGTVEAKSCSSIADLKSLSFMCHLEGIIGKVQIFPDSEPKLLLILSKSVVAQIGSDNDIYRIDHIGILALSPSEPVEGDRLLFSGKIGLDAAGDGLPISSETPERAADSLSESNLILVNRGVQKTLKTLRQATNFSLGGKTNRKDKSERDKLERRILEDIAKMFNASQSFYYSFTWDITRCTQQIFRSSSSSFSSNEPDSAESAAPPPVGVRKPTWRTADERFFWNRDLWPDFSLPATPAAGSAEEDHWIIPILQGYVQQEALLIDLNTFDSGGLLHVPGADYVAPLCCNVTIVSRRSRFRAGTRYKRRGIDEKGNVANYVETENILNVMGHCLSFVQVRGSIPVYWSQPGMKYRPAPRLDRSWQESNQAFTQHFKEQLKMYKHQAIVNLVEQTGREKVLADAYLHGILDFDNENLVYVSFDFHEYCRGLKLENIGILIRSLHEVFQSMQFFWSKSADPIRGEEPVMCLQRSVFRVNCVDCLDRTNVVQAAFARFVMESQLRKMGILLPDCDFPVDCKQTLQTMWANNGDVISRQYAGTSALKGDITRTGERKLAGLMKDGYTSANRYYLNQFKDAYRQAAIDATLGLFFQEESLLLPSVASASADPSEFERVKQLVDDCKRILIPETEIALGGWPVIDSDPSTGDTGRNDMDAVLLLSTQAYYVGEYSDESDQLVGCQRVPLEDVDSIEIGPEPVMFRSSRKSIIRVNYHIKHEPGYCHQFRSAGLRFFNSVIMPVTTEEESIEMFRSVAESFSMALQSQYHKEIPITYGKMQRKQTKIPPKDAAPVESEGGIYTAAVVPPPVVNGASHTSHLGDVLSAVKNKLADLNPIRMHLPKTNSRAGLYSLDQVSKKEISAEEDSSDGGRGEPNHTVDDWTFVESTGGHDEDGRDALFDSCGITISTEPPLIDLGNDQEDSTRLNRLLPGHRRHSRSSNALHEEPLVSTTPLVLSASPSMKGFHSEATTPAELRPNTSHSDLPQLNAGGGGHPKKASPSPARQGNTYERSKSKRSCRTKIIEL